MKNNENWTIEEGATKKITEYSEKPYVCSPVPEEVSEVTDDTTNCLSCRAKIHLKWLESRATLLLRSLVLQEDRK